MKNYFTIFAVFVLILAIFFGVKKIIIKRDYQILYYVKEGDFKNAYNLSKKTLVFGKYSYSKEANLFLAYMYMFNFDNLEKVDIELSKFYCQRSKICDIDYLLKEAKVFYCKKNYKDISLAAFGYKNKNNEKFNKAICKELEKFRNTGEKQ